MEFALVDSLVFLPPILIAGLVALYRNNILCFWECNPAGKALVQTLHTLKSTALLLRNTAFAVMNPIKTSVALVVKAIHSTALMIIQTVTGTVALVKKTVEAFALQIVAMIRGILVTISNSFGFAVATVKEFFLTLFSKMQFTIRAFQNSSLALWNRFTSSTTEPTSQKLYLYIGLAVAIGVILLTWYYLNQNPTSLQDSKEVKHSEEFLPVEEPKKEKKPVRRRSRRT